MVLSRRSFEPVPLVLVLVLPLLTYCAAPDDGSGGGDPVDDGSGPSLRDRGQIPQASGDNSTPADPGGDPGTDPGTDPGDSPGGIADPGNPPASTSYTNFGGTCLAAADCLNGDANPDVLCLSGIPNGFCTIACLANSDCGSEGSCALADTEGSAFCALNCAATSECGRPGVLACLAGPDTSVCAPSDAPPDVVDPGDGGTDPGPGTGTGVEGGVGEACLADSDCQVGALADNRCFTADQGWPEGYCTGFGCLDDSDCGAGSFCAGDGVTAGMCVRGCDTECGRDGYNCMPLADGSGLCLPPLPDPDLDPPNLGAPCTINDQCTMGDGLDSAPYPVCLPPRWPDGADGLPDGYCAGLDCTPGGFDCGDDGDCVLFPEDPADPTDADLYLCLEWCPEIDSPSTCRTGYSCFDDGYGAGVCFPQ